MKLRSFILSFGLIMGLAAPASASLVRTVDSFDVLVDYSGSMMMTEASTGETKLDVAKAIVNKINAAIPNLGYMSSAHTVAPVSTVLPYGEWNGQALSAAVDSLEEQAIFARFTDLGDGISELAPAYANMARPTAIILMSDGKNNRGSDLLAQAQGIMAAQPGTIINVVSFADNAEDQAVLEAIAALSPEAVMVNAADLYADNNAVAAFVADVFYDEIADEVIVLRGVNFAFDSAVLTGEAKAVLAEVANVLDDDKAVVLQGWTDTTGPEAYNEALSQRRANSAKNYLVQQGMSADSIEAEGMGESTKYDNATREGRYLNRRVEVFVAE